MTNFLFVVFLPVLSLPKTVRYELMVMIVVNTISPIIPFLKITIRNPKRNC